MNLCKVRFATDKTYEYLVDGGKVGDNVVVAIHEDSNPHYIQGEISGMILMNLSEDVEDNYSCGIEYVKLILPPNVEFAKNKGEHSGYTIYMDGARVLTKQHSADLFEELKIISKNMRTINDDDNINRIRLLFKKYGTIITIPEAKKFLKDVADGNHREIEGFVFAHKGLDENNSEMKAFVSKFADNIIKTAEEMTYGESINMENDFDRLNNNIDDYCERHFRSSPLESIPLMNQLSKLDSKSDDNKVSLNETINTLEKNLWNAVYDKDYVTVSLYANLLQLEKEKKLNLLKGREKDICD